MHPKLRAAAARVLGLIRRWPLVHRPVHAVAVVLTRTSWGERAIREVLNPPGHTDAQYRAWAAVHEDLTEADREAIRAHVARMASPPLISVVMPVYAAPEGLLRAAVESVRAQLYPHWELCIADDASPGETVWRVLNELAAGDSRIRIVRRPENGGISAATNSALDLARGEFVAFMDHDDLLAESALYHVAAALERRPDADLLYSDEDKIDARGVRFQPYFKPEWDPELMLAHNMANHLTVIRRSLVEAVGRLRPAFDGAQDHDLVLRVSERTSRARIVHIPWVLYHWRSAGGTGSFSKAQLDRCADAARRAVAEHLARTGQAGDVSVQDGPARWLRVRRPLPRPRPLVSVVIPTRDRAGLLERCLKGLLDETAYDELEVIVVDNGSVEPETFALFERASRDPRVRILPAPMPFNYAALINLGAGEATGDVLLQLNNDISVIHPDWLEEMVGHALRPNVGAVGALLLYPDGAIQHAGVVLGIGLAPAVAGHLYHRARDVGPGYQGWVSVTRSVSAVTGAVMAMRRSVYQEVGGMDAERLKVAFNDVDLCLKVRRAGYDIVWTPFAKLFHHESASRGSDEDPAKMARFRSEILAMRERWGGTLDADPFYPPAFDAIEAALRLAERPRRTPPWLEAQPPVVSASQAR